MVNGCRLRASRERSVSLATATFFMYSTISSYRSAWLGVGLGGEHNKGGGTTGRTEFETAGSGKDLGFWLRPLGAGRCKQRLTLAEGRTRHPQPLQPPSRRRAPGGGQADSGELKATAKATALATKGNGKGELKATATAMKTATATAKGHSGGGTGA